MTRPSDSAAPILALGLTPALQRTMLFDRFRAGEVNRALETHLSAAGKAVNVGLALAALGEHCVVMGFNGGAAGRLVEADMRRRGVEPAFTSLACETRTCTTIVDRAGGGETELVEEAHPMTPPQLRRFARAGRERLAHCRALAISGTLPPSLRETGFYAGFAAEAASRDLPWVIDSHREPLLAALTHRPLLAKLNARELGITCGQECRTLARQRRCAARLTAAGARWVLVTDGPRPALLLADDGRAWRLWPPRLKALNAIGSGDCATAGLLHALLRGDSPPEAARFGLACGSANAATLLPADFTAQAARRLLPRCRAEPLPYRGP
jgi:tagatose 6-phosphate kinase